MTDSDLELIALSLAASQTAITTSIAQALHWSRVCEIKDFADILERNANGNGLALSIAQGLRDGSLPPEPPQFRVIKGGKEEGE